MPATPSPNYSDKALLSAENIFVSRVKQAMMAGCLLVKAEPLGTPYHRERETYIAQVMNNPDQYKALFAAAVANDAAVIGDATVGGSVALTGVNVQAQGALVGDAHIDAALAATFNSFFRTPA